MKTKPASQLVTERTRRAIINLLKHEGAMDALALAKYLEISAMAVRQHLYALQAEDLVTYQEEARPMGRPAKLWQLTSKANRFFRDGYSELTLDLIDAVIKVYQEAGLEQLLERRTCQQLQAYQAQIPQKGLLVERLEALAQLRSDEGYIAQVQAQADGSFWLIEKHCPIEDAAAVCSALCRQELEMFECLLGKEVTIERIEHLLSGQRRCVYRIGKLKQS